MKYIVFVFLFISTSFYAQNYEKNWNQVVENENNGKIKSANELVEKIYTKAVRNKEEVQIIKCFFYKSKYSQVLDEDAQVKIINDLETQIKTVSIPSKAILNMVFAQCLNSYLNRNYSIQRRTKIDSTSGNFLTWTKADFEKEIASHYSKSIENEAVLKNTPLTNYEAVFDYFTLEKFKKERLLDYLLLENITFYKSKIKYWNTQIADYKNYSDSLLANTAAFTKLNLDFCTDENTKKILQLYQKLENNSTSIEHQLERLLFCSESLLKSKEDLLTALISLEKEAKDPLSIQEIQIQIASIYIELASKQTHPDYNNQALTLLDNIITKENIQFNPYKKAIEKKERLLTKTVEIELQKYIYNKENNRAFVRYKNANSLTISFFKITAATANEIENKSNKSDSIANKITSLQKPIVAKTYKLIDKKDYFEYTTEVLFPQLETGTYLVSFESESDDKEKKGINYKTITVSNISILANVKDDTEYYTVLDRKSGAPMQNVTLKSKYFHIKTNAQGLAKYKQKNNTNYYPIELTTDKDTLQVQRNYIAYTSAEEDEEEDEEEDYFKAKVEFYLDRAIYRPGQTVYYKGVAVQKKKNQSSVVPNTTFKISIQDPNYSKFNEFDVTTNEFGSFSGEFILPKSVLTGNFSIEAKEPDDYEKDAIYNKIKDEHPFWDNVDFDYSKTSFKVEEYKRPKFEVTFEAKKESFQINQSVSVKGNAIAFSGSVISDAKVTYTVTRYTNYYRNFYNSDPEEIIANSETKTDAAGKFVIDFIAKASKNAVASQLPVFSYRINANVTDINGETHSSQTVVKVGYHDLELNASIPNSIETKNENKITLNSSNLNGEFKAVKGELKLYYVSPFPSKFKPRVFQTPEIQTIADAEFESLFPYEINTAKTDEKSTEKLLYSKKIDTEKDKGIALDFISNYQSGNYKIVFSAKDSFDNPIENSTDFKINQSKDQFNLSKLFTVEQINEDPKKDGFALLKIKSCIPELYISTNANYKEGTFFEEIFHLQNNQIVVKIPVKKEFKNSITVGFQCVFENESFDEQIDVSIKTEVPKLEWSIESFRSKIQPGSTENWSFQLNASKTKNEAEVLASMYDSSLDKFTQTDWEALNFYEYHHSGTNFKSSLGFEKTNTHIQNLNPKPTRIHLNTEFSKLMWFGFDFNNNSYISEQYKKQLNKKAKKPENATKIYGYITDINSNAVPGVTITLKGTQRGTSSDFDGYYEIEAAKNEELVFSYIGFISQIEKIENNKNIDIVLYESENILEDVIVVGYGTQKKSSLTGSVSKAKSVSAVVEEDNTIMIRGISSTSGDNFPLYIVDGKITSAEDIKAINSSDILSIEVLKDANASAIYGSKAINGVVIITTKKALEAVAQVKARTNLSETAFFFPNLKTDSKGKVSFSFTSPEALTAWKLRLLAHNKNAVTGYLEKTIITQKELMVVPNFPRFFREKDTIVISAKIANMTAEAKTGIAVLQFFDATTMQPIDAEMLNAKNIRNFNIKAVGNTTVQWTITIPEGIQGVQYKVLAKAGDYSDGEENILPVLTNNMLVTESIPIWVRENSKKEYTFDNLKNNTSTTLRNHQFTLEYTSNPTWLAIQSLPYLMEYEHECAEQTFARFYANALASEIINSNPKIASVFETWRTNGKLNSKLEENEELKSLLLAETPWFNDAKSEDEKKQQIAVLFDLEKMKTSQEATFDKLKQKQNPSGGFPWFKGGNESEYITRHILAGLGHLSILNKKEDTTSKIKEITQTGIPFLDAKFLENYKSRTKNNKKGMPLIWINPNSDLHYLYARSFYLTNYPLSDTLKKVTQLYLETAKKEWLKYSLYEKGLAALSLNRFGEKDAAQKIIESLKETASNNEDWGMYWIANKSGWYWYQAPIETQALLIEAFTEVENDHKSVDAMKVWLLKNKQTKNWPTTKSTTEAVYALLMQGTDWLSVKDNTVIKIGDEKILTQKLSENQKEAETGYLKLNWKADEIKNEMATINIDNKSKVPGYGGVYWQYFEDLDKIKSNSNTSLSVSKELYLKTTSIKGEELQKITSKNPLKVGDLVTVRLIISSKEDMEFVHLKDMRASCFEPVDVLSGYEYKDGLGFYRSTKDVATHFFFDKINKGTYVLEYDIRVNNTGDFSNGITTIQSMYAPEYTSHTKGIRVKTTP